MTDLAEFTIEGNRLLRSEVLGIQHMYAILSRLTQAYSKVEDIVKNIGETFEEFGELDEKDFDNIIEKRTELLKKIDAVGQSITEGKLYITRHGRIWLDLLTELNLPVQRIVPLEIVSKDVPGRFFMLFKERAKDVRRLVIVSPWIGERSLIRRISRLIEQYSITTYIFTRSPEETGHKYSLDLLQHSGATIYINEDIHSKLYLCETKIEEPYDSFGIISSANLTRNARFKNVEVGIVIYGFTDRYFSLIENLIQSCYSLKSKEWQHS